MSFASLTEIQKRQFARNCVQRKMAFTSWVNSKSIQPEKTVLIVGDRPGPKAPQTDDYHHTPFYSKKWSGGWLNKQLVLAGIDETHLMWINSATWDGVPTNPDILTAKKWNIVIALGNNAAKWLSSNGVGYSKIDHPQAHRRFKTKEEYPLLRLIQRLSA